MLFCYLECHNDAECHYIKCHIAECCNHEHYNAECCNAEYRYTKCHNVECCHSEHNDAECCNVESIVVLSVIIISIEMLSDVRLSVIIVIVMAPLQIFLLHLCIKCFIQPFLLLNPLDMILSTLIITHLKSLYMFKRPRAVFTKFLTIILQLFTWQGALTKVGKLKKTYLFISKEPPLRLWL